MSMSSSSKDPKGSLAPSGGGGLEKLVEVISGSQHRYRELIDNLDQAVFTLSPDGEVLVANRRLSELLGVSFQDLIGRSLSDFFEAPTREEALRSLPVLAKKGSWAGQLAVRFKKTHELRYLDCWVQAVDEGGHVTSIIGWARDVTAQHESSIRITELFESLREGLFFTSVAGRVLDANPALIRMLGYESKEDLQRHNFREVYDDPSVRDALVREMEEKGAVQDRMVVLRRKDGSRIHCLASGFAIRDTLGRLDRLQGTFVDVSERLEIEKRLRQEQEFVRTLIASFPDVIAVLDAEGRFTYVSQRIRDILGRPAEDFIGELLSEQADAEDRPKLANMLRDAMAGRELHAQLEFRARHEDGGWRILRASAGPLFDDSGNVKGVVASARDVTESKRLEQHLSQTEKFTAMGQMLTGAAHELNNPLTAILGVGDLLRERAADDEARRHIDLILQQARRAAGIVRNLLEFSRPPAYGRSRIRLDEIVRQTLHLQQDLLRQKNITVALDAPADLPAVEGDRKLLTQVFLNIIANAEQAISSVRDRGSLSISISVAGGRVCVACADDGPGMSSEIAGKIFDPFFTTKRPGGSSGLGLTICLAILKEHGGALEVESPPGAGATFRVFLPVTVADSGDSAPPPVAEKKSRQEKGALSGHSLLVVDDEESIREIVQEGLRSRGMNVDCAESSEEALSHLATNSYQIILCDFNMPGLNGRQFFQKLRAQGGASIPRFVFMTGDFLERDVTAEFAKNGARVLQKPFHVSALAALLAELLQS